MNGVIFSKKPLGTARSVLASLPYMLNGKTGTATTSEGKPHSWFGGYSDEPEGGKPNIAVAVIVENSGEGSEVSAPFFKRVISLYLSNGDSPGDLLPWESRAYRLGGSHPHLRSLPSPTRTREPQ